MVIRMRHTRAHTKNRRSHHALKAPQLVVCTNCGEKHRPHHMCLACGFYKGRMVMDLAAKAEARAARIKAKEEAIRLQNEQIDPTEADSVAEAPAPEAIDEPKDDKK